MVGPRGKDKHNAPRAGTKTKDGIPCLSLCSISKSSMQRAQCEELNATSSLLLPLCYLRIERSYVTDSGRQVAVRDSSIY